MDGGFPYGDIIVIGAIAAFILLRYRSMLGEQRGRDDSFRPGVKPLNDLERVIQLPVNRIIAPSEKKEDLSSKHGSFADSFIAMRAIDREFSPEDFMIGARTAYEMVITAFTKRDRETLKMLLSPEIYQSFDRSLVEAENTKRFNDTTLVAITQASFKDVRLAGNKATITVDFLSDQIHLVRDENRAIIEGDPSLQNRVEDSWVFTRDLTNSSPNWVIIET